MSPIRKESIYINSLAVALIINAQYIAYIFNAYWGVSGGLVTLLYIASFSLLIVGSIFNKFKLNVRVSKESCIMVGYIIVMFLFSFLITSGSVTKDYFSDFVATGLITLFVFQCDFDKEQVILWNMAMALFFCINSKKYISSALLNISYERASMFASYILVPIILSFIYHIVFYRKKKWNVLVLYLANIYMIFRTISILGRGPLLSIVVGTAVAWIIKNNEKWGSKSAKNKITIIALVFIGVTVLMNIESILFYLNKLFTSLGIQVAALKKSLDLLTMNGATGLLNNRNDRWEWAFQMIKSSPLIGNGIGEYANRYMTWPHNVFLQILVELGVVLGFPLIYVLVKNIYVLFFKQGDLEDHVFLGYLFSISFIRLMLSSYLWHHPEFWMFMYMGIIVNNKQKEKNT